MTSSGSVSSRKGGRGTLVRGTEAGVSGGGSVPPVTGRSPQHALPLHVARGLLLNPGPPLVLKHTRGLGLGAAPQGAGACPCPSASPNTRVGANPVHVSVSCTPQTLLTALSAGIVRTLVGAAVAPEGGRERGPFGEATPAAFLDGKAFWLTRT